MSIYRGSIDATNLLAVVSKKQFVADGYEFTDDDQYGTYVCQSDSPCYSTLTLNIPFQTTTTTTGMAYNNNNYICNNNDHYNNYRYLQPQQRPLRRRLLVQQRQLQQQLVRPIVSHTRAHTTDKPV